MKRFDVHVAVSDLDQSFRSQHSTLRIARKEQARAIEFARGHCMNQP
jgi:hypothetical protein